MGPVQDETKLNENTNLILKLTFIGLFRFLLQKQNIENKIITIKQFIIEMDLMRTSYLPIESNH